MRRISAYALCLALLAALCAAPGLVSRALAQSQSVAAVVNDEAISTFDVQQRMRLLRVATRAAENAALRKKAIDELVDEKLMVQEANRLGVSVDQAEVQAAVAKVASRSKMNVKQFEQALRGVGINFKAFSRRIEAQLLWPRVVQKRFAGQVELREDEIERAMESVEGPKVTTRYEYTLRQITVLVREGASKSEENARRALIERIRRNFRGCSDIRGQVAGIPDVVVGDVVERNSVQLDQSAQTALAKVEVNGTTQPDRIQNGFRSTAVCSKEAVQDEENVRRAAQLKLMNQEFESLARRHLRDLRLDANIEMR